MDLSNGFNSHLYIKHIYNFPWTRASPYLYGLILGILYS